MMLNVVQMLMLFITRPAIPSNNLMYTLYNLLAKYILQCIHNNSIIIASHC